MFHDSDLSSYILVTSTKDLTDFLEANTQGKQSSPNWDSRLVLVRHSVHNVLSGKSRSCATRLHTRWRWNALRAWRSSSAAGRCVRCLVVSHVFLLQNDWTRFWFRDWDWALSLAGNAGEQPALGCGHPRILSKSMYQSMRISPFLVEVVHYLSIMYEWIRDSFNVNMQV